MKASLLMTASFSSQHCAPGKTPASHPAGLLSPLSRSRVWPIVCLLPNPSSGFTPPTAGHGKRTSKWEETAEFSVFFCRRKQGYFWRLSVQIRFFSPFSKPCVWQASGRGVEIRACILNTFAFLLGVSFVCLPLPGCLPCLRIVDFAQTLLSSQRK